MVQAILAGRKTQTRIVIKGKTDHFVEIVSGNDGTAIPYVRGAGGQFWAEPHINCPHGKPGDVLWVRETLEQSVTGGALYRAGGKVGESLAENEFLNWDDFSTTRKVIPSIHMPKDAARIWLRITNVRVERLQDISEDDAIAEGCSKYGPFGEYKGSLHPNGGSMKYRAYSNPIDAFKCVWESISGEQSWKSNPWVWVVEFERIEKP